MNTVTTLLATAGSLVALTGASFGVVQLADARYAKTDLVEDLVWSGMKREIRELERDVDEGRADQEELDELLDRFCRNYPDDRDCKER